MRHYTHMTRSFLLLAILLLPALAFGQEDVVFAPLTGLPGLNDVSSADTIAGFLNVLYRLCVGAAATLAVIQIIRAGFLWMKGDSVTGSKEARDLIKMALFGLLLVLSPAIIFGVIDPRILSLSLNTDALKLEEQAPLTSGRGNITEAQTATIVEQILAAARNCGIDATTAQAQCAFDNRSNNAAAEACFPGATEEELVCTLAEVTRRVQGALSGDPVNPNEYRYLGDPGSFISLGIGVMQDASCKTLFGQAYETDAACQSDLPRFEEEIRGFGWSMLFRCQQLTSSGGFLITAENLCPDQTYLP
jgi:hypothetical protein